DSDTHHRRGLEIMQEAPVVLLALTLIEPLSHFFSEDSPYSGGAAMAEDLLLPEQFFPLLRSYGVEESHLDFLHSLILALTDADPLIASSPAGENTAVSGERGGGSAEFLETLLGSSYVLRHLRVNRHLDVEWFRGESFQELTWWVNLLAKRETPRGRFPYFAEWVKAESKAEYRLQVLKENI
ncbi:MAG: hypothetical protein R6V67_09415, partial [Spirochaetia bacterium]